MANKDYDKQEGLATISELVEEIEEVVHELPIRNKVRDIVLQKLVEWQEELEDAITLSPTDW